MKTVILSSALFAALCVPALGQNTGGNMMGGNHRGVPGPVMGAGLPIIAAGAGYALYCLIRRRKPQNSSLKSHQEGARQKWLSG
jgi:hypothetical protein